MDEILKTHKELTVNRLPVLTWNHLKVNDSKVILPEKLELAIDSSEIRGLDDEGISLQEHAKEQKDIATGMVKEALDYVLANATSSASYTITENKKIKEPLVITKKLKADWLDYISILAKKDSEITVILSYESLKEAKGLHGNAILMDLQDGAKVRLLVVQLLNQNYEHFTNIGITCEDHASVEINYIGIGAKKFWVGCEVNLLGRESSCKVETSYLGGMDKQMDFNLIARHIGKKTVSEIKGYGVLAKNSRKIMRGTIDFIKGAKGAVGSETENVLMLSKEAENKSVPLILCAEDDVDGRHGASIGNINAQQLFYLNSRGISREEAHKIFAQSLVERMKDSIEDEKVKDRLGEFGGNYLEQLI